jgi:hypothetical protein
MSELLTLFLANFISPILMFCFLFILLCGIASADGMPIAKALFNFLMDAGVQLLALFVRTIVIVVRAVFKLVIAGLASLPKAAR